MGLNTNTKKTVSMKCRPCTSVGNRSEEAYGRFIVVEGLTFMEKKRERGSSAGIAERRWRLGHWTHTACPSMGRQGKGAGHGQTRIRGGRGRASEISDRFPQGGDEGVSSGRMSGEGRDTDGDAGAFLETACEGHRDHLGGRKPPSSKMPKTTSDMYYIFPKLRYLVVVKEYDKHF